MGNANFYQTSCQVHDNFSINQFNNMIFNEIRYLERDCFSTTF